MGCSVPTAQTHNVRGSQQSSVWGRPLACPGELGGQLQKKKKKKTRKEKDAHVAGKEEREQPRPCSKDKEG